MKFSAFCIIIKSITYEQSIHYGNWLPVDKDENADKVSCESNMVYTCQMLRDSNGVAEENVCWPVKPVKMILGGVSHDDKEN